MSNYIYRAFNLIALGIVCYFIGIEKIGVLGYIISCVLMWNVIEGVNEVEVVKEDTYKDLQIGIKDLRIYSLEQLVKAQEMVIGDYKKQVENK